MLPYIRVTKQAESVMGIRRNRHKKEAGKMKSMEITAVGIDVSKRKSTVAIRRPGGVIVACPCIFKKLTVSTACSIDKKQLVFQEPNLCVAQRFGS